MLSKLDEICCAWAPSTPCTMGQGLLTLWIRVQGVLDGSLQGRQVFDDSASDRGQVDPLIRVAELVSDTSNIAPRHARTKPFGFVRKPDSGFADDL